MQTPPIPAGFSATPPQNVPPIPPGFTTTPPPQAAAPRPAPRPTAPASSAAAPAQNTPMTDLGISPDEEITSLVRQGYTMDQARAMAAEPEGANYAVASSEDLAPEDTPESLRSQGYELDPERNVWARTVGTIERLAPSIDPGYQAARARINSEQRPGYDMAMEPTGFLNDEMAYAAGALGQGVENVIQRMRGQTPEIGILDRANAERDAMIAAREQFQRERPLQSAVGGVLGGFAMPATRIPSLLGGLGQAATIGTGIGFAEGGDDQGMLTGEGLRSRLKTGGAMGALSAGLAGVAPFVPGAVRRLGSGFSEAGARIARGFGIEPAESVVTPRMTAAAERYVGRMVQGASNNPLENSAVVMGKPVTLAETLGPSGVAQVTALSRRSGQTGEIAGTQLAARAADQPNRVVQDFADLTGVDPAGSADLVENIVSAGRRRAAPLWDEVESLQVTPTPAMNDILRRPSGRAALRRAYRIARDEGVNPESLGMFVMEAGDGGLRTGASAVARDADDADARVMAQLYGEGPDAPQIELVPGEVPSIRTLDYVRRGLNQVLEGFRDRTTRRLNLDDESRPILDNVTRFREELINATGGEEGVYARALSESGDYLRVDDAFRRAPKLFQTGVNAREFTRQVGRMGAAERNAIVAGLADDLYTRSQNGRLKPKDLALPVFQEKLSILLGPDAAQTFINRIRVEMSLSRTGGRMAPGSNSTTFEAIQAASEQDRGSGLFNDFARNLEQSPGTGIVGAGIRTGMGILTAPVAGFVRGVQAPAGQGVRDEIGRLLMATPDPSLIDRLSRVPAQRRGILPAGAVATSQNEVRGLLTQ